MRHHGSADAGDRDGGGGAGGPGDAGGARPGGRSRRRASRRRASRRRRASWRPWPSRRTSRPARHRGGGAVHRAAGTSRRVNHASAARPDGGVSGRPSHGRGFGINNRSSGRAGRWSGIASPAGASRGTGARRGELSGPTSERLWIWERLRQQRLWLREPGLRDDLRPGDRLGERAAGAAVPTDPRRLTGEMPRRASTAVPGLARATRGPSGSSRRCPGRIGTGGKSHQWHPPPARADPFGGSLRSTPATRDRAPSSAACGRQRRAVATEAAQ